MKSLILFLMVCMPLMVQAANDPTVVNAVKQDALENCNTMKYEHCNNSCNNSPKRDCQDRCIEKAASECDKNAQ